LNSESLVAIGLGSNLGDRAAHLAFACDRLSALLDGFRVSSTYTTRPVGVSELQPDFFNAAAIGRTALSPRALLDALLAIEQARGRQRPWPGAARTLDLDLLLAGESIMNESGLAVPHPRLRERRFVLEPLSEIAPDLRDPVSGLTIRELLAQLPPAP